MEYVWFDIDLETLPPYDIWKPASHKWALTVNWAKVNDLIRNRLSDFPTQSDSSLWKTVKSVSGLTNADRVGLWTLYTEPIYATPAQISSGGHRLTAMRTQGLRWALGQCHQEDIGVSVDELHAYPALRSRLLREPLFRGETAPRAARPAGRGLHRRRHQRLVHRRRRVTLQAQASQPSSLIARRASGGTEQCTGWSRAVPPRRRRSGYQPGELSEQMRDAITAEATRLDALGDDLETIRATAEVFNALEDAILAIGEPRLHAVARLRAQGWSYNRLVAATGLSKTRVAQLVSEARARGIK